MFTCRCTGTRSAVGPRRAVPAGRHASAPSGMAPHYLRGTIRLPTCRTCRTARSSFDRRLRSSHLARRTQILGLERCSATAASSPNCWQQASNSKRRLYSGLGRRLYEGPAHRWSMRRSQVAARLYSRPRLTGSVSCHWLCRAARRGCSWPMCHTAGFRLPAHHHSMQLGDTGHCGSE